MSNKEDEYKIRQFRIHEKKIVIRKEERQDEKKRRRKKIEKYGITEKSWRNARDILRF